MTNDEFQRWFAHHRTCYPRIDVWLGRLKGEYDSKAVLRNWYKALQDVELEYAIAATDAMFRGDFEEPREWDQHPRAIRKAAHADAAGRRSSVDAEPQYIGGTRVYRCQHCLDLGLRIVWHPKSMQAIRDGTFGGSFTVYSCSVRCTCQAANKYRWLRHEFDEQKMVPCEYRPTPEDEAALLEFVNGQAVGVPWTPEGF